ncbi:autotransporter-associated beta strand repeat-containing protein [Luteolibacter ambystomatis]|uniref:Autotransporter-associated beta strand repeat-containing protein n=1 Tax=Luteolibacter ambystomatis TaxID=2824561 RepID=A0A975IY04_9BACT|nr:autotransporter-associated beta strand repeat-containing protein [Luteolibacter ambystomatis]QUE49378.1 autotransporter-associated beta strand repeat-containing protein [Luteolibacter ambystomatis]
MKPRFSRLLPGLFVVSLVFASSHTASATSWYWDADGDGSATTGGTGTWTPAGNQWRNGSAAGALSTYTAGPQADATANLVLAGADGATMTATAATSYALNKITASNSYTLATVDAVGSFVGTTPTVDVASGKTLTWNMDLSAASTTVLKTGTGSWTFSNTGGQITSANTTLEVVAGTLRYDTAAATASLFTGAGGIVKVDTTATLSLQQNQSAAYTSVRDWTLGTKINLVGGTLTGGSTNGGQFQRIPSGTAIQLDAGATTNTISQGSGGFSQNFTLDGAITGAGSVTLARANSNDRYLVLKGSASGYSGNVTIGTSTASGYVVFGHATGWGTGTLTLTGAGSNAVIGDEAATVIQGAWTGGSALGFTSGTLSTTAAVTVGGGANLMLNNRSGNAVLFEPRAGLTVNGGTLSLNSTGGTSAFVPYTSTTWTFGGTALSTVSARVQLSNTGVTFDVADAVAGTGVDTNVSGVISGANGFTKTGVGTLQLSGANTFTGLLTVSAGDVLFSTAGAASGIAGGLAGSGAVKVAGTGLVTLNGNSPTYTGTVTVADGAKFAGDATTAGPLTVGATTGATLYGNNASPTTAYTATNLTLNGTSEIAFATPPATGTYTILKYTGTLSGSATNLHSNYRGSVIHMGSGTNDAITLDVSSPVSVIWTNTSADGLWNTAASGNWYDGANISAFYTGDQAIFDDNGVSSQVVTISAPVFPGSVAFSNNAIDYGFTGAAISGTAAVTKNGSGSITLSTANAYTGGTLLNGGVLRVGAAGALGTGTLTYTSGTLTAASTPAVTVGNAVTYTTTSPTFGDISAPGPLTLSGAQTLTAATQFNVNAPVIISGAVSGAFQLTKSGTDTLTFSGSPAHGATVVDTGTLQVGTGAAAGVLPGTATINTGATLRHFRNDSSTVSNVFSGAGTLAFKGTGTSGQSSYTLSGANTVSGTVVAENGARVQATNAAGTRFGTAAVEIQSGGQTYLTGGTFANNFTINGNGWLESAGNLGAIRFDANSVISGSVAVNSASRIVAYTSNTGTMTGALFGSSALEINASSSANFNGTVNYSGNGSAFNGPVTVSQGTFNLSGSLGGDVNVSTTTTTGTLGGEGTLAGNVTLGAGSTGSNLVFNPNTTQALTATGLLTVNNTATVSFSTVPAAGGTFAVIKHGGTTALPANFALANATNYRSAVFDTTTDPTTVTLQVPSRTLTWTGASSAVWDVGTTANFTSPGPVVDSFYWLDSVTFDDTATNFNPTLAVAANPGTLTFNNSTNAYTLTGAGAIGGGTSLVKNGTGAATISTANTFTGGTQLNAGRIKAGANAALGTGSISFNGGTLSSDSATARTIANPWTHTATVNLGDATDTGALTLSGAGTLTGNATFNVLSTTTSTQVISGVITDGANSYSVTKTGAAGALQFNTANTYDGGTFINAGRLSANNVTAFGTGSVTIAATGQAYLVAGGTYTYPISIAGTGYVEPTGNLGAIRFNGNTLSGALTLTADARLTAYGSSGTLSGVIGETGGARVLEYGGTFSSATTGGTFTVSAANTYTGGTTVTNSIINVNNGSALGTGPVTVTGAATTGRLVVANGLNLANAITLGTNVGATGRGVIELAATSATATLSGPITVTSGVSGGGHLFTDATSTLTITGSITSASAAIVQRVGNVVLSGGGSYTSYQITGLTKIGATNGMATNATPSIGISAAGTLDLNGFNQTLAGLQKSANAATVTNNGASASVLTVSNTGSNTYDGTVVNGTSAISLVKSGAGTFTVTAANTYSGGTTISGGILQVGGSAGALGAGAVVNNANLTLARTATFTFPNAISGSGGVTQSGTGTTTLSGALSYTGDTSVTTGTLSISTATLADGADVRLATGAVLNLNHALTDSVRSLYINGVAQPVGTYGSLTSSATFKIASITGNGILNVTSQGGYTGWAAVNAGGQAANLDFDGDGVRNGVEYLMGQTGSSFTANPQIVSGKVTWPKDPSANATWVVETSTDLSIWTTTSTGVTDLGTSIEYVVPTGSGKRFARLRVTVP